MISGQALLAQTTGELIRWDWITRNADDIWERTVEHLALTGIAIGAGFLISLALSVVALRVRRTYSPITRSAAIIYTIPSIALFPALIPFTGIDILTASIGLTLYTLLMFVRNIVAGLEGVPDDIVDAARGMGYTRRRLFLEIELPLAIPVVIAGFRIATVTTIGLVTITGLFGMGGLGFFIFDGMIRNFFITELLVGAVGALVLALIFDGLFVALGAVLTPWARRAEAS
ncbi:MAG: ABC transporter permease [Nitriliruptorales bacterium]